MLNQATMDMLTAMKMTAMPAEFANQLKDPTFNELGFEERLGLLVNAEWNCCAARGRRFHDLSIARAYQPDNSIGESDAFGNPAHCGIDIPAQAGTPILAAHSCTVLICGWNDSFGNQVLIDDGVGLSTRYAHVTATAVFPGAEV